MSLEQHPSVVAAWTDILDAIQEAEWIPVQTFAGAALEAADPVVNFESGWVTTEDDNGEKDNVYLFDTEPPPGVRYAGLLHELVGGGITSWWGRLSLLEVGDSGYLAQAAEEDTDLHIAWRLRPFSVEALRAWFIAWLPNVDDGHIAFGDEFPMQLTNPRPDLLDRATILTAYRAAAAVHSGFPADYAIDDAVDAIYSEWSSAI